MGNIGAEFRGYTDGSERVTKRIGVSRSTIAPSQPRTSAAVITLDLLPVQYIADIAEL